MPGEGVPIEEGFLTVVTFDSFFARVAAHVGAERVFCEVLFSAVRARVADGLVDLADVGF